MNKQNVTSLLTQARDLIADPARWTTGNYAIDAYGSDIDPENQGACQFCALGALMATKAKFRPEEASKADWLVRDAGRKLRNSPFAFIPEINDGRRKLADGSTGHPAIMKIYDRAIELSAQ